MSLQILEGNLSAQGLKFAIAVAPFNSFVTDRLSQLAAVGAGNFKADRHKDRQE